MVADRTTTAVRTVACTRTAIIRPDALVVMGGALGDRTRCAVLLTVLDGIAYPAHMAEQLGLSRAGVSEHLTYLGGCGLLVRTRGDKPAPSSPTQRWSSGVTTTAWPAGAAHVPETPAAAPGGGLAAGVRHRRRGSVPAARRRAAVGQARVAGGPSPRRHRCRRREALELFAVAGAAHPATRNAHPGACGSRCWSHASTPPCCSPSEAGFGPWRWDGWGSPTSWPGPSASWPCSVA